MFFAVLHISPISLTSASNFTSVLSRWFYPLLTSPPHLLLPITPPLLFSTNILSISLHLPLSVQILLSACLASLSGLLSLSLPDSPGFLSLSHRCYLQAAISCEQNVKSFQWSRLTKFSPVDRNTDVSSHTSMWDYTPSNDDVYIQPTQTNKHWFSMTQVGLSDRIKVKICSSKCLLRNVLTLQFQTSLTLALLSIKTGNRGKLIA